MAATRRRFTAFRESPGIITLLLATSGILVLVAILVVRFGPGQPQRLEAQYLEFSAATRTGEDLAPIHIEFSDGDRMLAHRAGGQWETFGLQLKSIFTTRVPGVAPQSTRAEKDTTQNERSIPDRVLPATSRLRGW